MGNHCSAQNQYLVIGRVFWSRLETLQNLFAAHNLVRSRTISGYGPSFYFSQLQQFLRLPGEEQAYPTRA